MKLTPVQQYSILGVIFLCGLAFGYYQLLLKPKMTEIEKLRATLEEKRKDLEEAKKIVAKYVEFKKRADTIQRELEWFQNRIPKVIEKTKMIEAMGFLQNRSGVYLTNFIFVASPTAKDAYAEVPVTVKISTNFSGLLNFLREISLSPNFMMTVRDLNVIPASSNDDPGITISAQMTLCGVQAK
jgi:Tfp pilus assembly protein PilO